MTESPTRRTRSTLGTVPVSGASGRACQDLLGVDGLGRVVEDLPEAGGLLVVRGDTERDHGQAQGQRRRRGDQPGPRVDHRPSRPDGLLDQAEREDGGAEGDREAQDEAAGTAAGGSARA